MNRKTVLWFAASITLISLKFLLTKDYALTPSIFGAHPFVVFGLCLAFGWMKRDSIFSHINDQKILADPAYLAVGVLITAIFLIIPLFTDPAFALFNVILLLTGVSLIFFGAAAYLPSLLVFVYGFSISFPVILDKLAGTQYALLTTRVTAGVAGLIYPVGYEGQLISIIDSGGIRNLFFIDAGCSGSASLAIFLTVFALMLIDIRPPSRYILPLFLFGIIGTSVQNILRLVLLLAANYHLGMEATWQVHDYAGYVLFPIWFSIFIYVYLKAGAGRSSGMAGR
jgi:exosortase/archaeosortase family protein